MTTAAATTFGTEYASIYDLLYAEKDYERECDLIEGAFRSYGSSPLRRVLDLGCGTGNHAVRLAERGYGVTGVDLSTEMLRLARAKTNAVRWLEGDARSIDTGEAYDAALLMFAVLGYQHTNRDVLSAFRNVRRHLRNDGLLVFDAWHGPGVLTDPPGEAARTIATRDGNITRTVSAELDSRHHICTVHYELRDSRGAIVAKESHHVRYFFPMELELYLEACGLRLLEMRAFDEPERAPTERDWNVFAIARAV